MASACVRTVFTVEKSTRFFSSRPPLYLHRRVTVFVKAPAEHRDNWRNYPGPCEQSFPNGVFQIQRWIKCPFILAKPAPGKYTQPGEGRQRREKKKGRRRETAGVRRGRREGNGEHSRDRRIAIRSSLSECVSFRYLGRRI